MEAAINGPFGRIILSSSPLTIGRAPDNELVINDVKASGHHAELRPEGQGRYAIVDVGSSNGTFVNEQRLGLNVPRLLQAHDVIRIGSTSFTYEESALFESAPTVYAPPAASGQPAYAPTVAVPSYPLPPPPPPVYNVPPAPADPYSAPPPVSPAAPAPVVPPVPVAAQPKKRSRFWPTCGIIAAVVLVLVLAFGVFVYVNRSTPEKTLRTFCTDLQNNDEGDAYQQLASGVRAQESEATFAASVQQVFARAGGLQSCTSGVLSNDGMNAVGVMTWSFNATPQRAVFTVRLLNESGQWKISGLTPRG
jgi:hypothetical protein